MKKLYGFTIAELLVCLVIVGILMTTAIFTFRPFDKGIKYIYSNTFYALDRAIFNATQSWLPHNLNLDPWNMDADSGERTRRLCLALTEYINTIEPANATCNTNQISAAANDEQFNDNNLQFTATNGVRYYISKLYWHENNRESVQLFVPPFFGDQNNLANRPKFFVVYADINGTKGPNSMRYEKRRTRNGREFEYTDPDIFAFAIIDMGLGENSNRLGRVCPIGVPEVEPRYMTTRIRYRTHDLNNNNAQVTQFSFPSRPYAYSKAEAWAYYVSTSTDTIENPQDEDADNSVIQDNVNHMQITPEEPLSYNDYIRFVIENDNDAGENGSQIYSFLGGRSIREYLIDDYQGTREREDGSVEYFLNLYFRGANPLGGVDPFFCENHNIDHCEVFVDRYIY